VANSPVHAITPEVSPPLLFPSFFSVLLPARVRPELGFLTVRRRSLTLASMAATASLLYVIALPATAATAEAEEFERLSQDFEVASSVEEVPAERNDFNVIEFTPVQWPVGKNTDISSTFGYRTCAGCSTDHQGIDFTPGAGKKIEAIADGKVVEVGNPSGALGVYAIVQHDIDGKRYRSVYAHMQSGSLEVKVGDKVKIGDKLGRVGSTGMSTGPHLHFGILNADKQAVDPLPWLKKHATE
jgi:murein DD-endopeptidase MepM/ murein hydrolase activator NlpD